MPFISNGQIVRSGFGSRPAALIINLCGRNVALSRQIPGKGSANRSTLRRERPPDVLLSILPHIFFFKLKIRLPEMVKLFHFYIRKGFFDDAGDAYDH